MPLQLREPLMTMRQRAIDDLALRVRSPFRTSVEQPSLQQIRCEAGVTLRDVARDRLFPLDRQCRRCSKRV